MTFLSLVKPYRKKILFILLYIFIVNILSLALPWGVKMVIDEVLINKDIRLLNFITMGLLVILCLRAVFSFLRRMSGSMLGENIVCDLRERVYDHTHKLSLRNIKKMTPSQILTRITGDVESIRRFIFGDVIDCIYSVLSVGIIIVVLLWINTRLTLSALLLLPFFTLFYFRLIPKLKVGFRQLRDINGELTSRVNEVLNGMAVVRSFTAEQYEKGIFARYQKKILEGARTNHFLNLSLWVGIDVFTSVGTIGVLWIGGLDVISGRMTSGELIAFYSYLSMLFTPIIRLVTVNSSYQEASAALGRINEVLDLNENIKLIENPIILSSVKGSVEFKNVAFGYNTGDDVLKNISFSVKPGEVIGIVGASGVGKTTLINLLVRFFDPGTGEIYIDGHRLKDLDLKSYRNHLAIVLQDDYLFNGTIRENICYGNPGVSENQMREAAQIAQAENFIYNFPKRYRTQVGERGVRLSTGQRQRVAIARALARNPSILILDEATSAIDAMTENKVQQSVSHYLKGRTVFIVAHRFSTIMEADKIIVLEKGEVVEMGDHNYLLERQGFYSSLYFEQFKDSAPEII